MNFTISIIQVIVPPDAAIINGFLQKLAVLIVNHELVTTQPFVAST